MAERDWAEAEASRCCVQIGTTTPGEHEVILAYLRAAEERGRRAGIVEGMRRAADLVAARAAVASRHQEADRVLEDVAGELHEMVEKGATNG